MNGLLVSHSPGSVAIVDADDGTAVTYGQLWERVTRAADGGPVASMRRRHCRASAD